MQSLLPGVMDMSKSLSKACSGGSMMEYPMGKGYGSGHYETGGFKGGSAPVCGDPGQGQGKATCAPGDAVSERDQSVRESSAPANDSMAQLRVVRMVMDITEDIQVRVLKRKVLGDFKVEVNEAAAVILAVLPEVLAGAMVFKVEEVIPVEEVASLAILLDKVGFRVIQAEEVFLAAGEVGFRGGGSFPGGGSRPSWRRRSRSTLRRLASGAVGVGERPFDCW